MKHRLLILLQRPSTWLCVLSAGLLALVLLGPEAEREGVKSAAGHSQLPRERSEATKKEEKPEAAQAAAAPVKIATEMAPPPMTSAAVAVANEAPKAVAATGPQQGPPSLERLREMEAEWERGYQGVPEPDEVESRISLVLQGPPDPANLTRALIAVTAGPPSPADAGPPAYLRGEDADEMAAKEEVGKGGAPKRGVDSEFAHGEGEDEVKVAGTKAGPQKPTTRITPPAAPTSPTPSVAAKPEPQPPPLSEEPLPPAQGDVWKVVKVEGRDYVTGQSIRLFYRFSTHKVEGKHVWFRNPNLIIKGQVGSQELLVNNIKFILSYPVLYQGGQALFSRLDLCKLIEPVIRPAYIGSSQIFDTVVLDAGHGGHDSGAKGVYGYEKNYALAMAFAVRDALLKRGFKVIMTRTNDTFLTLTSRVAVANRTPNSIFISLHFNSGGSAASGIETFALTPQGSASSVARGGGFSNAARVGNEFDSENIALATAVHAQVVHRFKLIDRGIKRARWTVLTGCQRPGILFEGGFVTNSRECQLIASDQYRKAVAEAIGDAVTNYRRALAPTSAGR